MHAVMVVLMDISDDAWIEDYFAQVPPIIAEYGGLPFAASRSVSAVEGEREPPDRIAVITFPTMAIMKAFLADARYQRFKLARQQGSQSDIFVFDNAIGDAVDFA